jgi:hypothetical protein
LAYANDVSRLNVKLKTLNGVNKMKEQIKEQMEKIRKNLFETKKRHYDSQEIYKFVNNLYTSANWSVISYTAIGVVLGYGVGQATFKTIVMAIGTSAIGGAIGYQLGMRSAYKQKAEAQLALCQVEIEKTIREKSQN